MKHLLILCIFLMIQTLLSSAQGVFIDSTFGNNGVVVTDFNGDEDGVSSLLAQPDGKIVVAGVAFKNDHNVFALARYHNDGTPDSSFSNDGKLTTNIGQYNDAARAMLLQPDGKLVVAGGAQETYYDFAVVRYNSNGTPDPTFGDNGIVTTDIGLFYNSASDIILQPDGKLVAAGSADGNNNTDFALARYNSDGTLDSSFGNAGTKTIDIGNGDNDGCEVILQPDNKIVLAGPVYHSGNYDFALARFNTDGSLDNSFGTNGKVITDFDFYDDFGRCSALQDDGKILVAGYTTDASYDYNVGIARYMPDGSLDNSFGTDGTVNSGISDTTDMAYAIIIEADGSILVTGTSGQGSTRQIEVVKYNKDGSPDTDFSGDGIYKLNIPFQCSWASSMITMDSGKIVLAGSAGFSSEEDFLLVRLIDLKLQGFYTNVESTQVGSADFDMYPNPTESIFKIELPADLENQECLISITNAIGQEVFSFRERSSTIGQFKEISLDNFPQGFYFVNVVMGKTAGNTKMLVKI